MNRAVILLGSNLGDRYGNIVRAQKLMSEQCGFVSLASLIYETEPWGMADQPAYLNAVVVLDTILPPVMLMKKLLQIEVEMERLRNVKWEPRTIDLDILYYNDEVIHTDGLTLPHPRLHERRFTLVPLAEILPDWFHPILLKNHKDLLHALHDDLEVKPLKSMPV